MEEVVCVEGPHVHFCGCFLERGLASIDLFGGFGLKCGGR